MAQDTRAQVWAKTHGHCWYCGKLMNPWNDFTIDHMDPRTQGGGDEITNLVPACKSCNSRKNAKTVEEYRGYLMAKGEQRFWFEHAALPLAANVIIEPQEEDSDEYWPDQQEFSDIIEACLFVGKITNNNLALTLIALATNGMFWRKGSNLDYDCDGYCDIDTLANATGLPGHTTLSHLFSLMSRDLLSMSWKTGPYESHEFTLNIAVLLMIRLELRRRETQARTRD